MDVLIDADLYKLDFVRLSDFFEKSDLVRKVNGFIQSQIQKEIKQFHIDKDIKQSQIQKESQEKQYNNSKSVLYAIKEFMRILSFRPDDGKFIISRENDNKVTLQYLCLNPTTTLKRMMDQVKAIIFISGTLEPSQEFNMLLKHAESVSRFNCDHIIPKQHF